MACNLVEMYEYAASRFVRARERLLASGRGRPASEDHKREVSLALFTDPSVGPRTNSYGYRCRWAVQGKKASGLLAKKAGRPVRSSSSCRWTWSLAQDGKQADGQWQQRPVPGRREESATTADGA